MQLHLGDDIIEHVSNYKFLGIIFQSNGLFDTHETVMLNKINVINHFITRLCLPGLFISPLIIRSLIKVILIPSFNYAFAVWRPSDIFMKKCTYLMNISFRLLFHLPSSTNINSLFQELRLFPLSFLREWLLFLYIKRLLLKHESFPAKVLLLKSYSNPVGSIVNDFIPLHSSSSSTTIASSTSNRKNTVKKFQALNKSFLPLVFDLHHIDIATFMSSFSSDSFSKLSIKQLLFNEFIHSISSTSYSSLRKVTGIQISLRIPLYFSVLSTKQIIRLLRVRFDIWNINGNIIHRHMHSYNHYCPYCMNVIETREHVLLFCPHYFTQRQHLLVALNDLGFQFQHLSLSIICGEYPSVGDDGKGIICSLNLYKQFIEYIIEFIDFIFKDRLEDGVL
jgi:hypothetical protein